MKKYISMVLGIAAIFAASCTKPAAEDVKPSELSLSVTPQQLDFSAENEVKVLKVETNASTLEISDNLSWLGITRTNTGYIVEASENDQAEPRSGVLTVFAIEGNLRKTAEVSVSQEGAGAKAQFPDEEFRRLMLNYCDADGDGIISQDEADKVTELELTYDSESTDREIISSLEGIKIFRNLKNLECDFNAITSLDLSGMDKLEYVNCSYNKISSLKVQGCTSLMQLYANVNELASLDLSSCDNIKFVQAYKNSLNSFELKDKAELGYLDVSQNQLSSIKVSGCPKLGILNCGSNSLTKLELGDLPALYSLGCYKNNLVSLDVTVFDELLLLECYGNNLTSLDLSGCKTLGSVKCSGNLLTSLALPQVRKDLVTYVECENNRLTELDVTMYPNIKRLVCSDNFIESLKVEGCSILETLTASNNKISELSLEGLQALTALDLRKNSLKELDVRECRLLESLDARENPLEAVWIEKGQSIKDLKTDDNDNIVKVWRDKSVLTVSPRSLEFSADGGELSLNYSFTSPVEGESVKVVPSASWLSVKSADASSIVVLAEKNADSQVREAVLTVNYADADPVTVTVSQEAAAAKLSFKVELTKVWYESAEFTVTPSEENATYIAYARPKNKVEGIEDDALIEADIKRLTEWGSLTSSGSFWTGTQTIKPSVSRWTSKDYYVVVYGLTADGARTNDEVIRIPFTLSSTQPYISADSVAEIPVAGGTYTVNYSIDNEREGEAVTVESMDKSWLHIESVDTAAHTITIKVDECTKISYSYPYKREGSFIIYHADATPYTVDLKQKCPTSSN